MEMYCKDCGHKYIYVDDAFVASIASDPREAAWMDDWNIWAEEGNHWAFIDRNRVGEWNSVSGNRGCIFCNNK